MSDSTKILLIIFVPFTALFLFAYLLDRWSNAKGDLFAGEMTPTKRFLALTLALFFGVSAFVGSWYGGCNIVTIFIAALAVALGSYGLGWEGLLRRLEGRQTESKDKTHDENQT